MPELPEVEAVCGKLRRDVLGLEIVACRVLRPSTVKPHDPLDVERKTAGRRIEEVERLGKNIFLHLSRGRSLHVHLRMTGNLYAIPDYRFAPHSTRVLWQMEGNLGLIFEDSRALGTVRIGERESIVQPVAGSLGPDPLSEDFSAARFIAAARKTRQPIKLFLMDQKRIAGLGNIWAAEALFAAGIHPERIAAGISAARLGRLHTAIGEVLAVASKAAAKAYERPGFYAEEEAALLAVYGHEGDPCRRCRAAIRRIRQGGRSTCFCPRCQR